MNREVHDKERRNHVLDPILSGKAGADQSILLTAGFRQIR